MADVLPSPSFDQLLRIVEQTWGYRELRPLQEQAMRAVLDGRDSLVVLPTGGGKSLCYQAPALVRGGTTIVVSPLISLMKDQVDGLRECGVPAIQFDSSQTHVERQIHESDLRAGAYRLLFVAPERLALDGFRRLLKAISVHTFAIDEAHCISHWGHDFRQEYRQLRELRAHFPAAAFHAYTATATEQVRHDIVQQLGLREPAILVGDFDRPNLTYRALTRRDLFGQVVEILDRHRGEAGIIYCIRRLDVDELCQSLRDKGYAAMPYHAGLSPEDRKAAQDAFANEECDLIVATVAFGMGIDRSNIRFVVHAGMPKSVEHYQQEAGRAGRDGLPSECVLLYTGADLMVWKRIIEKSAAEADNVSPEFLPNATRHLNEMNRYCAGGICRHRFLVEYFGQRFPRANCGACDHCLGDVAAEPHSIIIAQKILSCVARVKESFGIGHVIAVLRGEPTDKVLKFEHNKLSTFALLRDVKKQQLRIWIDQLIAQGLLSQSSGDYPVLKLNPASWEVMRGQREVSFVASGGASPRTPTGRSDALFSPAERDLFEAMRTLRRRIAVELRVPPFVVFNDVTLRELVRLRPKTPAQMRSIPGIGDRKLVAFGERFLTLILKHEASP